MDAKLQSLLEKARRTTVSESDKEKQRISFAYGNSRFENDTITRETVARASQALRDEQGVK